MFAQNCLKQKVIRPEGGASPQWIRQCAGLFWELDTEGSNDRTLGPVVNLVEAQIENDWNISVNKSKNRN